VRSLRSLIAVALTVGKDPPREPIFGHVTHHIGCFGLPSDSSTSAHVSAKHPLSSANSDYHSPPMLPSDMVHDGPVNVGHLIALESTVDGLRSQNEATLAVLQDILSRLGPAPALNVHTSAGWKKIPLKPSPPLDFDGERSAGKAFLMSCRTYIWLRSEAFDDDLVKVIWAMSYMNAGRAGRWAARKFETEAHKGRLRFLDWLDFEEEFKKDFLPLNAEAAAVNALEMTDYFQGDRTADAYLDQFRDLICDAKYSDPKTIVVKFRRGLNHRISMALAGMPIGRPSDRDPEAWFRCHAHSPISQKIGSNDLDYIHK